MQDDSILEKDPSDVESININLIHPNRTESMSTETRELYSPQGVSSTGPNAAYFGCGVVGNEPVQNCSTLIETSDNYGAAFLFSIKTESVSTKASRKIESAEFIWLDITPCGSMLPVVSMGSCSFGEAEDKPCNIFSPSRALYVFFENEQSIH